MSIRYRYLAIVTLSVGAAAAVALPLDPMICLLSNCSRVEVGWDFFSVPSRKLVEFPTQEDLAIVPVP
jgi:hypothetical protein